MITMASCKHQQTGNGTQDVSIKEPRMLVCLDVSIKDILFKIGVKLKIVKCEFRKINFITKAKLFKLLMF